MCREWGNLSLRRQQHKFSYNDALGTFCPGTVLLVRQIMNQVALETGGGSIENAPQGLEAFTGINVGIHFEFFQFLTQCLHKVLQRAGATCLALLSRNL